MSENPSLQKNINISEGVVEHEPARASPTKSIGSPNKSKSIHNELNPKSPFVTGTNIVGKSGIGDKAARVNEVYDYHDKLNGLIDVLDNKVKILLNENQNNFLLAYKEQMTHVQKELKGLKKKLDEETHKRKSDERLNILEQERDYFQVEALRLDRVCKEQQRVIQDLKFKLKLTNEDKNYYEEYVLTAKKENKALKEELMQLENRKTATELPPLDFTTRIMGSSVKKGKSIDFKQGLTPRKRQALEAQQEDERTLQTHQENFHSEHTCPNEKNLLEIIQQLKGEVDKEKRVNRQIRHEKSQLISNRFELEQILLESVNEVKREIAKRKNIQKAPKDFVKDSKVPLDVDISKFTAVDKKNVLEYFLSNSLVLEEVYNLIFGSQKKRDSFTREKISTDLNLNIKSIMNHPSSTTKSEGKLKYSFNYGFGNPGHLGITPKELDNVTISKRSQGLLDEIKKLNGRRAEISKREL